MAYCKQSWNEQGPACGTLQQVYCAQVTTASMHTRASSNCATAVAKFEPASLLAIEVSQLGSEKQGQPDLGCLRAADDRSGSGPLSHSEGNKLSSQSGFGGHHRQGQTAGWQRFPLVYRRRQCRLRGKRHSCPPDVSQAQPSSALTVAHWTVETIVSGSLHGR